MAVDDVISTLTWEHVRTEGNVSLSEIQPPKTNSSPKRLPVFILADTSYSMAESLSGGTDRKIDALNRGVADLIVTCGTPSNPDAEIHVAVITFGDEIARAARPLTPSADARWVPVEPSGSTPMGAAIRLAIKWLEDKTVVSRRDYRPIIVLLSDGAATDDADVALGELNAASRASKADRFAVAVGANAYRKTLADFVEPALKSEEASGRLFQAGSEHQLEAFFKYVSQTATLRGSSTDPNAPPPVGDPPIDGLR
jgi:uncharacterized protein YegL